MERRVSKLNQIPNVINNLINQALFDLENYLASDVIAINSSIVKEMLPMIRDSIEMMKKNSQRNKLSIILTTNGGSAEVAERLVYIFRKHYNEVDFFVPDYAYSAGTILCMSGDNIFMDYYSVLGPIDPQVMNKDGVFVPALGYLDKIKELLDMAKAGTISEAEFLILKDFDLAELKAYEQAKNLTVDLLKEWLVKYKFKNWNITEGSNKQVTKEMKDERAEEIAKELGDHNKWLSHGRALNIEKLTGIGLKIEDFGLDQNLSYRIKNFHNLMIENMQASGINSQIRIRGI